MELPVYVSKKGTKVVRSTELHRALQLTDHHYPTNVRRWLQDVYEFHDTIRRPQGMKDYAKCPKQADSLLADYYLSTELAKLIALASRSKVKLRVARYLSLEEEDADRPEAISYQDVLSLVELIKAMSFRSCRLAAEEFHKQVFYQRHSDGDYWNQYRTQLLGYKKEDLRKKLTNLKKHPSERASLRDLIGLWDPNELIRIAILDHFAGQGKHISYAQAMGKIAKELAAQMQVELVDDRREGNLFAPQVDPETVRRIKRPAA